MSEPVYVLPEAHKVPIGDAMAMLISVQQILYVEDDGEINPDKEWDSDTLDAIGNLFYRLRPHELTSEEMSAVMHKVGRLDT